MKPKKYSWLRGAHIRGSAQAVGERLALLSKKHGGKVTPRIVLADARSKHSPLHGCFEWNNNKAAEAYRLRQAGAVIAAVVVVLPERQEDQRPVRAYVHVDQGERGRFVPIAKAMSSAALRKKVLNEAWAELEEWRRRYEELRELGRVFRAMDTVQRKLKLAS